MIDVTKLLDPYERKARLYPALICLLPITIAVFVSFPEVYSTFSGLIALVVTFGGLQFLSHLARDRGKLLENRLFNDWGGIPSVTIFRHRDSVIPKLTKLGYHSTLSNKTGIAGPSEEIEKNDPATADEIYRSWSDHLRTHTRDETKFSLLFKENINYGFRRNLLGIKLYCLVSGLIGLGVIILPHPSHLSNTDVSTCIAIIIYISTVIFVVNGNWVKVMADEYAKRLVEAVYLVHKIAG